MAWQMNYTDSYGVNYPESYWRIESFHVEKEDQEGFITFVGYASKAQAGERPIGQHILSVTPQNYVKYLLPTEVQPAGIDHFKQSYVMSAAVLDTAGQSFFHGATAV